MGKSLDFNTLKKRYFPVTLNDENKTKLLIVPPTKRVFDEFAGMKDALENGDLGDEAISELYGIVARLMSHNKTGIKVTKEMIEELLDFEDVILFIRTYTEFITEVTNSKN